MYAGGSFFAAWLASEMFGLEKLGKEPTPSHQFLFVTIRTDNKDKIDSLIVETIKETFSKDPTGHEIILEPIESKEKIYLDVFVSPKKSGDKPAMRFGLCFIHQHQKDHFFLNFIKGYTGYTNNN
jgi:hypothetical protein